MGAPLLIRQSPLAYPGGVPAGFDPSHIAAKNTIFSGMAAPGGGFYNLLNGSPGTLLGAPGAVIDGVIGPSNSYTPSGANPTNNYTVGAALAYPAMTIAGIFRTGPSFYANNMYLVYYTSGAWFIGITASTGVPYGGSGGTLAAGYWGSFALSPNTPYFYASSGQFFSGVTGVMNGIIVNLLTGQTHASSSTAGTAPSTATQLLTIGNVSGDRPCGGNVARVMLANQLMTPAQLAQWGQAPWDYWHPQAARRLISSSISLQSSGPPPNPSSPPAPIPTGGMSPAGGGWFDEWDRRQRRRIPVEQLRAILKAQGSSWADELGDAYEAAEVAVIKKPKRRKIITAALEDVSSMVETPSPGLDLGAITRSLNAIREAERATLARKHAENIRLAIQAYWDAENDDEEALMLLLYG